MASETRRNADIDPAHPGDMLGEIVIPATGKSKVEIAALLGISRQSLYDIIGGKQAVTPGVAVRLAKLFGNGPGIWLRMQQSHDLWHAERELADTVKDMPTLRAA